MTVFKSLIIAFSTYSRIPVPQFEWKEADMKYSLCFFPWVGAVIGLLLYLWEYLAVKWGIGTMCITMIGTAIPLIITGGFHVDGFMDTMDAFHSYQSRERKLEILKDSHIGAFSVIMLVLYYLIYIAALSEIQSLRAVLILGIGFVLSRILSGLSLVYFQPARKEGMLYTEAGTASKRVVKICLILQGMAAVCIMFYLSVKIAALVLCSAVLCFLYYRNRSYRELGGITGDTAGYFVTICECAMVIAAAVGSRL